MTTRREQFGHTRRWVIKIGSSLTTNHGKGLCLDSINRWVAQAAELVKQGKELSFVTSGAVAEGVVRLGLQQRPSQLHQLQAAAAVGQMGLIQAYETSFRHFGLHTAQVLLTHADLSDRQRYLNSRSTFQTLVAYGVIPIVNENDTVATEELRFGDNDTLAALIGNLVEAHLLIILTDQEGLFDQDPRYNKEATLVKEACAGEPKLQAMAGGGGTWGRGGMQTKVQAAKLAARSGTATIIVSGHIENVLLRIAQGEELGTLLYPQQEPLAARKQWLAGGLRPQGRIVLDNGAVKVISQQGKSLLSVGVTEVDGDFVRGELVSCYSIGGNEIARGLVNYNAHETRCIMGKPSDKIAEILGYIDEPELIHRDNLVLL